MEKSKIKGGDMDIDFMFRLYDPEKDKLSDASINATQDIVNEFTNEIRLMYDKFNELNSNSKYHEFAKGFIETGQAETKKQMLSHLYNPCITALASSLKEKFTNLMDTRD